MSTYTCPTCHRTSHNPVDAFQHYCSYCHTFEGQPRYADHSTPLAGSITQLPPLDLGRVLRELGPDDDLLAEMRRDDTP